MDKELEVAILVVGMALILGKSPGDKPPTKNSECMAIQLWCEEVGIA